MLNSKQHSKLLSPCFKYHLLLHTAYCFLPLLTAATY
jgi:hypothetical protein